MKRIATPIILSALSYLGGHFYNRRWDRALLFLVLFVVWLIGVYVSMVVRVSLAGYQDSAAMARIMSQHSAMAAWGTLFLWLCSLAFAYLDARKATDGFIDRWTLSGRVGALGISIVLTMALLFQLFLFAGSRNRITIGSDEPPVSTRSSSSNFSHHILLGGNHRPPLAKAPSGDGVLVGRFVFQDKPAAGVRLTLNLNGKYETDELTTDTNGEFQLQLPRGDWYVSRVVTHDWREHPQSGQFMVVTGDEPKLANGTYRTHHWWDRQGIAVSVGARPPQPQLTFSIRERVALRWPPADATPANTTIDKARVAWAPYPNAETYLLQLSEVIRQGSTTSYHDATTTRITGATEFALAHLPAVPSDGTAKEYAATVLAFDQDGNFLSESPESGDHAFVLADNKQFVRNDERIAGAERFTEAEFTQAHANNRRFDAAVVLLNEGMHDEAERLLAKIKGKTDPGKKLAVNGYLMAKRGRCAEANALFAKALSEGGASCVPDYYRATCAR